MSSQGCLLPCLSLLLSIIIPKAGSKSQYFLKNAIFLQLGSLNNCLISETIRLYNSIKLGGFPKNRVIQRSQFKNGMCLLIQIFLIIQSFILVMREYKQNSLHFFSFIMSLGRAEINTFSYLPTLQSIFSNFNEVTYNDIFTVKIKRYINCIHKLLISCYTCVYIRNTACL